VLEDAKILVTGPAGQIAEPLTRALAAANEVWGIARFGDAAARARIESYGVTTRTVDLGAGDFGDLPTDFTHVLHLAADLSPGLDYDHAVRVNAEGTGLLLQHCRAAKAALVMSTCSVYKPSDDAGHAYAEADALGDANSTHAPTYSVSKIAQEAVARACARAFGLPVTIARMKRGIRRQRRPARQPPRRRRRRPTGDHPLGPVHLQRHPRGRHLRPDRGPARRCIGAGDRRELGR